MDINNAQDLSVISVHDVLLLMQDSSESEQAFLYNKHQFDFIQAATPDGYQVNQIFSVLPDSCRSLYLQALIPKIPTLLTPNTSALFCAHALEFLTPMQRTILFESMQQLLIVNFKEHWQRGSSNTDLLFLNYLTKNQCVEFLKPLEGIRFSSASLATINIIGGMLSCLSEEHCSIVCETWKNSIQKILVTPEDVVLLFEKLPDDGLHIRSRVYDMFKDKIAAILNSSDDEYQLINLHLDKSDQLDLRHRMTEVHLLKWVPKVRFEAFIGAIMQQNNANIKRAFDVLLKPQYTVTGFFSGQKQISSNVIQIIAHMEVGWLQKLNHALLLELTNEELVHPKTVQIALGKYAESFQQSAHQTLFFN